MCNNTPGRGPGVAALIVGLRSVESCAVPLRSMSGEETPLIGESATAAAGAIDADFEETASVRAAAESVASFVESEAEPG